MLGTGLSCLLYTLSFNPPAALRGTLSPPIHTEAERGSVGLGNLQAGSEPQSFSVRLLGTFLSQVSILGRRMSLREVGCWRGAVYLLVWSLSHSSNTSWAYGGPSLLSEALLEE